MVIDDDVDVREALVEALRLRNYQALPACNGREALELLRSAATKPCLILLDLMMPVMNGWQFRAVQKQDRELGDIPVVAMTAHAASKEGPADIDAAHLLRKPIRLDVLFDAVERCCADPHGAEAVQSCEHHFADASRAPFMGARGARVCRWCERVECLVEGEWIEFDAYVLRRRARSSLRRRR